MTTLEKLLHTLQQNFDKYAWYGYDQGLTAPPGYRAGDAHGSFVALKAQIQNFDVRIKAHDYSKEKRIPKNVGIRRPVGDNDLVWIEIKIDDEIARYGRRSVLGLQVLTKKHHLYAKAKKLFDAISKVATFQKLNKLERLDSDKAVLGFCKEINA
jgi:hypothetical protein